MGAFRDRARTIRYPNSGPTERIRGGFVQAASTNPDYGPWFRCYYDPGTESEQRSTAGVRRRRAGAALYTVKRALDGSPVDVLPTDQVEINSRVHGMLTLYVEGTPERFPRGRVGLRVGLAKTNMASTA